MSKFSYNANNNTVRITRDSGETVFISGKGSQIRWSGKGKLGVADGLRGFGDVYDAVGLSREEFDYVIGKI